MHVDPGFAMVAVIIVVALIFDYINGFHDAANSIATVVTTRVLSPGQAVLWAAFFNFAAVAIFGTGVAKTVGKGMVDLNVVTFGVILAGLIGAIIWNLITWYFGLPTSSSHALFGGYAGAAVAKAGVSAIIASGWTKTLVFIVVAPLIGMTVGLLVMTSIYWLCQDTTPMRVDRWFRRLQLMSAAAYSLMHGANDAQKTMGIITGALVTYYASHGVKMGFEVPLRRWLTGQLRDWADDLLSEDRLRRQGHLNAALVAQCWREHRSGAKNWQNEIWHALMFQAWLDSVTP